LTATAGGGGGTKLTKVTKIAVGRFAAASLLVVAGCTHAPPNAAPKPNPRAEQALAADLNRIFDAPAMEHGLWGVEVKSLDSGRLLYARNPGR
jgi:hypothetical protein